MNPEVKFQWLVALRSGEYKQGKFRLKSHEKYCCLGVLCDLHRELTGNGHWDIAGRYNTSTEQLSGGLVGTVQKWAGLSEIIPSFNGVGSSLAHYNDTKNYSFERIAELIDENY